jgi:hypothetical protein
MSIPNKKTPQAKNKTFIHNAILSKIRRLPNPSYQQLALRMQQDATQTISTKLWLQNDWAT